LLALGSNGQTANSKIHWFPDCAICSWRDNQPMAQKSETLMACKCPKETPTSFDQVMAAMDQLRNTDGHREIEAGDLVSKSGIRWLDRHGFAVYTRATAHLTTKGIETTWVALFQEHQRCFHSFKRKVLV